MPGTASRLTVRTIRLYLGVLALATTTRPAATSGAHTAQAFPNLRMLTKVGPGRRRSILNESSFR
ncbi:MAG: hypothetical protein ACREOM_11665 [Candidatus Dormibacteraceae bacterium]